MARGACAMWRAALRGACAQARPALCAGASASALFSAAGRRRMRTNRGGRGEGRREGERRLARTHAQLGGSGAGNVCVGGLCPGAAERGGATEHAQAVGGREAPLLTARGACAPSRPRRGCGERRGPLRWPHVALPPSSGPRAGKECGERRRGLPDVGPAWPARGVGILCAAEGPAQRKREYPPPFPSALSPQARPLAAA